MVGRMMIRRNVAKCWQITHPRKEECHVQEQAVPRAENGEFGANAANRAAEVFSRWGA